ncbi:hypothetical protein D3C72_1336580 [compost metagenome]
MDDRRFGVEPEQLAHHVHRRAHAGGTERHRVRPLPRRGGQLLQVACRQARVGDDHMRHFRQHGHHFQVGRRVVVQLLEGVVGRVQAKRAQQQRIAVSRRIDHGLAADMPAGTRAVLDHHRLVVQLAELVGQHAALQVRAAARAERHDDADRAIRIMFLRRCGAGAAQQHRGDARQHELVKRLSLHALPHVAACIVVFVVASQCRGASLF